MFRTTVHQTLEDRGNADQIEEQGPFKADAIGRLYLGNGSYFWDDHIELAHWWGKANIKGDYVICQADMAVRKIEFYDLAGCRQDMKHLKEMIKTFGISHLALGKVIEFLKDLQDSSRYRGIFPFRVIRAVDDSYTSFNRELIGFVDGKKGETSLTPVFLICLIAKSDVILSSYRIIYPLKYINGD